MAHDQPKREILPPGMAIPKDIDPWAGLPFAVLPIQAEAWHVWTQSPSESHARFAVQSYIELEGPIDVERLARSINALVRRHAALRTHFVFEPNGVRQIIEPYTPIPLPDWTQFEKFDGSGIPAAAKGFLNASFNPNEPPWRIGLFRKCDLNLSLALCAHHSIMDAESMTQFWMELSDAYDSSASDIELGELDIQVPEVVEAREQFEASLEGKECRYRVSARLDELFRGTTLSSADAALFENQVVHQAQILIPSDQTSLLRAIAVREKVSLSSLLVTTFEPIVQKITLPERALIAMRDPGRDCVGSMEVLGPLSNPFPIALPPPNRLTLHESARIIEQTYRQAYRDRRLPWQHAVPQEQLSLFNALAWSCRIKHVGESDLVFGEARCRRWWWQNGTGCFTREIELQASPGSWTMRIESVRDSEQELTQLLTKWMRMLRAFQDPTAFNSSADAF